VLKLEISRRGKFWKKAFILKILKKYWKMGCSSSEIGYILTENLLSVNWLFVSLNTDWSTHIVTTDNKIPELLYPIFQYFSSPLLVRYRNDLNGGSKLD